MTKIKVKMLEIWANTHMMLKAQSAMRDMSMREYIEFLVKQDKQVIMKGI